MSSLNRPLAGPMLTFDLAQHLDELRREEAYEKHGRAGRTLAKSGRFRLLLAAVADGQEIGTHQADSPLAIHVLEGEIQFRTDGGEHRLRQGQVLYFGPGDAHDIRANGSTALLITISAVGDDFDPQA